LTTAFIQHALGQYTEAIQKTEKLLEVDPFRKGYYMDLSSFLLCLLLKQKQKRNPKKIFLESKLILEQISNQLLSQNNGSLKLNVMHPISCLHLVS